MGTKNIADLSDEDIDALDPAELLALQHGGEPVDNSEGEEGEESDEGDDAGDAGAGDEGAEGGEGGDAGAGDDAAEGEDDGQSDDDQQPALTREQLEALASEKDDDEDGAAGDMVPRSRLNEVLENQRNLRLILQTALATGAIKTPEPAAAQQDEPQPAFLTYDFKAKAREQVSALANGDEDKALALADEIEEMRAAKHAHELEAARTAGRREAQEVVEVRDTKAAIAAAEADIYEKYPFLNGKGKTPHEAAILAVNAKAKQLVAKGKSVPEALVEAAEKVGGEFAKLLMPKEKTPPATEKKTGKDTRTGPALQRNLNVRQPPQQKSGVGNREQTATIDLRTASDEQIARFEKNHPDAYRALLEGSMR